MNSINNYNIRSKFLKKNAQFAWEKFSDFGGYPTSGMEEWRFSNPEDWLLKNISFKTKKEVMDVETLQPYLIPDTITIFIANDSIFLKDPIPNDISILKMSTNLKDNLVRKSIGEIATYHSSSFNFENLALFREGLLLDISKNFNSNKPIHIINAIKSDGSHKMFPRIYVNIGSNSKISIIQSDLGLDDNNHYFNTVTEVVVNENAHLTWTHFQKRNLKSSEINSFNILLRSNSFANYSTFEFGGKMIRKEIHSYLQSEGVTFECNNLFIPTKNQHIDIFSKIHHKAPHCNSNHLVKGILGEKSKGVFRGLAHIYPGAKKTNAKQTNNNLLLSDKAKMNSIPQLEIYEEDVKCSHGSTTGQIEDDAIFYLQSRGINIEDARKLMIKGFADELINKVDNEYLRKEINIVLRKKFEELID